RIKLIAFVVAAAGTGLVAALIAVNNPFIQPDAEFAIKWSAEASFMAVVGGLGTIEGPLLGTAISVVLHDKLAGSGEIPMIVLWAVSIIVVLLAPGGIAGFVRDRWGWTLFPIEHRAPARQVRPPDI